MDDSIVTVALSRIENDDGTITVKSQIREGNHIVSETSKVLTFVEAYYLNRISKYDYYEKDLCRTRSDINIIAADNGITDVVEIDTAIMLAVDIKYGNAVVEVPRAIDTMSGFEYLVHELVDYALKHDLNRHVYSNEWRRKVLEGKRSGWWVAFVNCGRDCDLIFSRDYYDYKFYDDDSYKEKIERGEVTNYIRKEIDGTYTFRYCEQSSVFFTREMMVSTTADPLIRIDFSDISKMLEG